MTAETIARIAGDTAAIAIALLGWIIHVRSCRQTTDLLAAENKRLIEALARTAENGLRLHTPPREAPP